MNDNNQIMTDKGVKTMRDQRYSSVVLASVLNELEALLLNKKTAVDYMVFKELSELVDMARIQAMQDIALMRMKTVKWAKSDAHHIQNTWALYRRANTLYHTVYSQEIERCHNRRYRPDLKVA